MSSHRKNNACDRYDNDERYRDRERDRLHDDDDGCGRHKVRVGIIHNSNLASKIIFTE